MMGEGVDTGIFDGDFWWGYSNDPCDTETCGHSNHGGYWDNNVSKGFHCISMGIVEKSWGKE